MRKILGVAASLCCIALPSSTVPAATLNLASVTPTGSNFTFNYSGFLAPTEGVKAGSQLVVFDFAGYVPGSISATTPFTNASVALSSPGFLLAPGVTDDPSLFNLVFTYTGPDFQTTPAPPGSPYPPLAFSGLSAQSVFGGVTLDGFATRLVNNAGIASVGTDVFSAGLVGVPIIPEPATWAMMIAGLGVVGYAMRRRRNLAVSFA